MEKEFVPYELALRMKALGFDEPCFQYENLDERKLNLSEYEWFKSDNQDVSGFIKLPTYQSAFRWFREKYGFDCSFEDDIVEDDSNEEIQMWDFFIFKTKQKSDNKVMTFCSNNFDTYIESYSREEAELACLEKLLEIVESKKE